MSEAESEPAKVFGIPTPDVPSSLLWAYGKAEKEEREWSGLDKIKQENDGRWLKVYGWILVALTITFAVIFIAALLVWTWHHIAPACIGHWRTHWLDSQQLGKIQSILFSGGMGAVISGIVRTQVNKAR
ncbi:hypothetical protein [Comamonas kerstersii]|uniref:hypothetical protein n=1 Tax=Comamonas kerstersii TaxID=225992 RepID=UPI0026DAEB84|nr:hypothetical protein [Comamonas kerstersii]